MLKLKAVGVDVEWEREFSESQTSTGRWLMLVLSRKLGEKIVIGENIRITVVKIDRNQIRIGIEAPGDVPVFREEIAPQRAASQPRSSELVLSH